MKFLVLLSLVALCFAIQPYSGQRVTVGEDGTVTIIGTQGREIYIYKNLFNPRKVDIVLKSPMGFTRKVVVDEVNNMMDVNVNTLDKLGYFNMPMEQITQADVLTHLFRQYEGIVEEPTFQMILEHIQTLVNSGIIHESVYDVLMNLEQLYMIEELKRGYLMEDGEMVNHVLPKMMTKDVMFPVESGSVHGVRNVVNVTPYQRIEMLLQQIRQQHQMEQMVQTMTGNVPTQEYEMTPLTRFMYNIRQGYPQQVPQSQVMGFQKLIQKLKFNTVVPQQWTQGQVVPQQWIQGQVVPQQWMQSEVVPQQWTRSQVVPQQWTQGKVVPQQWIQGQVVPQQWMQSEVIPQQLTQGQVLNHLVSLERMMEQGQILPEEFNMLKQHYQKMMMMMM